MQEELIDHQLNRKFVNADHMRAYRDAASLLDQEVERQRADADRLMAEWKRLPDEERAERISWLERHFHACRQPYVNLLVKLLDLTTPVYLVPLNSSDNPIGSMRNASK